MKKIIALALSLASFTAATQAQKLVWFPEEVRPQPSHEHNETGTNR